jgi:hypothetical protein
VAITTYQGTVKNGVVVFKAEAPPEGTQVRVEPVPSQDSQPATTGSIWQKLTGFAGRAPELPNDAARQHDHYLYGRPKR